MTTFDSDRFIADCVATRDEADQLAAIRELVERAVSMPAELDARFPVPLDPEEEDGILLRTPGLMITSRIFPSGFTTGIHDHTVAAVIGVWNGIEDNLLFDQVPSGLVPLAPERVEQGEVLVLSADAIHDVHVPSSSWSCALHVYLGDIIEAPRSEWADAASEVTSFDGGRLQTRWKNAAQASGLLLA